MFASCKITAWTSLASHQRGRHADLVTFFALTVGQEYAVLGMTWTESTLYLLVADDDDDALFAPAGLFEDFQASIPPGWFFSTGPGLRLDGPALWEDPVVALWGYRELIEEPDHASRLEDRDKAAIEVFKRHHTSATKLYRDAPASIDSRTITNE